MARAISVDLRQRVCAAIAEGFSCHQAAARFKVSVSNAIRWQARLRDEGSFAPQQVRLSTPTLHSLNWRQQSRQQNGR